MRNLFTSESVSEGHPDKVCDQISDAVLDALLKQDKTSRVACETFVATGMVLVGGEITTKGYIEVQDIVRNVIRDIGYTKAGVGFDADSCSVLSSINSQSPDIAQGVDTGGAGDQGMMFSYASSETPELMPATIMYAHKLVTRLANVRKNQPTLMPYLRPDAKSQVTVEYDNSGKPIRVDTVVVSTSPRHDPNVTQKKIKEDVIEMIVHDVIPSAMLDNKTRYFVNPTGRFEVGGPHGDSGLTGRKIVVDTSGEYMHMAAVHSPERIQRKLIAARHTQRGILQKILSRQNLPPGANPGCLCYRHL